MNKVKRNGNATKKTKGEFFVMKVLLTRTPALPAVYACPPVRMFTILMKKEKQRLLKE